MPRLGPVQQLAHPPGGYGFVVHYDDNEPAVSLGFSSEVEAVAAEAKMREILATCKALTGHDE